MIKRTKKRALRRRSNACHHVHCSSMSTVVSLCTLQSSFKPVCHFGFPLEEAGRGLRTCTDIHMDILSSPRVILLGENWWMGGAVSATNVVIVITVETTCSYSTKRLLLCNKGGSCAIQMEAGQLTAEIEVINSMYDIV